jgi:hypothetical protein
MKERSVDDGMTIAAGFFALGVLWLFIGQLLLLPIAWMKGLLG